MKITKVKRVRKKKTDSGSEVQAVAQIVGALESIEQERRSHVLRAACLLVGVDLGDLPAAV